LSNLRRAGPKMMLIFQINLTGSIHNARCDTNLFTIWGKESVISFASSKFHRSETEGEEIYPLL
jgi:hypothetical protein